MLIDLLLIIILIFAVVKGYSKGFIMALFSFIAIIIGLIAATKLSAVVANYLSTNTSLHYKWLPILSFIIVMIATILLIKLIGKTIEKLISIAMMGWSNKILGIVLYAIMYITVFSFVLFFIQKINVLSLETIQSSKTFNYIQPWAPNIIQAVSKIIPSISGLFEQLNRFF